ncbi:CbrC family protein [Candidatus Poribacteria bacterium]|nr:CbrC family protein [Candidatus Poribacteria bacterium]
MLQFRRFHNVEQHAVFTENPCEEGHRPPFLDGDYFEGEFDEQGVCLECLLTGRKVVVLDPYLRSKIETQAHTPAGAKRIIRELERTPPVPWIQYNDWPFCCGEPMQYRGEYSRDHLFADEELADFPQCLWEIVDAVGKQQAIDFESLQDSIADGITACFIFKCLKCHRFEAVCQSY